MLDKYLVIALSEGKKDPKIPNIKLWVISPKWLEVLMNSNIKSSSDTFLFDPLNKGSFASSTDKWKLHSVSTIDQSNTNLINEYCQYLISLWKMYHLQKKYYYPHQSL